MLLSALLYLKLSDFKNFPQFCLFFPFQFFRTSSSCSTDRSRSIFFSMRSLFIFLLSVYNRFHSRPLNHTQTPHNTKKTKKQRCLCLTSVWLVCEIRYREAEWRRVKLKGLTSLDVVAVKKDNIVVRRTSSFKGGLKQGPPVSSEIYRVRVFHKCLFILLFFKLIN